MTALRQGLDLADERLVGQMFAFHAVSNLGHLHDGVLGTLIVPS